MTFTQAQDVRAVAMLSGEIATVHLQRQLPAGWVGWVTADPLTLAFTAEAESATRGPVTATHPHDANAAVRAVLAAVGRGAM